MSPTYRLPFESAAMQCTQLQSPGFSRPSAPLGTVQSCSSLPCGLNFMNTWSFGGHPSALSSLRQRIGEEPHTQISSSRVTQNPHGTHTLLQTSSILPAWSKTWTRTLLRSATYRRPLESTQMACGMLNWPGFVPRSPHSLTYLPSLSKWTTRELP